jgi:hypothetical protein
MYQPCQLHPLYPLHDPIPTLLSEVLEVLKTPKMLEVPEVRALVQQLELELEQAGVPPRARSTTTTTAVDSSPDPCPGPCLDLGLGFAMEPLQLGPVHAWAWSRT